MGIFKMAVFVITKPLKYVADVFDFDTMGHQSGRPSAKSSGISFKAERVKESSLIGPGPKTNRVLFDTYVNSPLVKHYLCKSRSGDTICKSLRMHITQVEPMTRESIKERMTYDEFLRKSRQSTKRNYQTIQRQTEETGKERQRINGARMKEMRKIEMLKDKILMKPSETKAMSEQIIEGWMVKMMTNANKPSIRPATNEPSNRRK